MLPRLCLRTSAIRIGVPVPSSREAIGRATEGERQAAPERAVSALFYCQLDATALLRGQQHYSDHRFRKKDVVDLPIKCALMTRSKNILMAENDLRVRARRTSNQLD